MIYETLINLQIQKVDQTKHKLIYIHQEKDNLEND